MDEIILHVLVGDKLTFFIKRFFFQFSTSTVAKILKQASMRREKNVD